jgi:hypothetical protein
VVLIYAGGRSCRSSCESNGSGRVETEGDMPRFEGASLLSVRFRTCDGARLWPKWIDDALEEGWEEPL